MLISWTSRTYGKDTGEDIREGYEPAVVDPKDSEGDEFAVAGDDDEQSLDDSEESRQWKQATEPEVVLKPKYGLEGEEFENVWSGGEPSEAPRENP